MSEVFWGYRRPDGRWGVRNHVAILAVMDNVNGVVRHLAQLVRGTLPLPVWYGRGQFGPDEALFRRTQVGLACNPNIAAVLVVSLESVSAEQLARAIRPTGKPVAHISVQDVGGTVEAMAHGVRLLIPMVQAAAEHRREPVSLGELVLGVECGGTDTTSGIASNPAVGAVADYLVAANGSVYLSETSEWMGAEQVLARRAATPAIAAEIFDRVRRIEDDARSRGVDIRGANPVPDNIRGGITTIEEKSLGAIIKGGGTTIQGVLEPGAQAPGKGLYLMDTAAPAGESMTGLAAGGAQVILFTTGQMNIMGSAVAPTIKITGNPRTAQRLADNVDVDVSGILTGQSVAEAGEKVLAALLATASGRLTRAEVLGDEDVVISKIQPTV